MTTLQIIPSLYPFEKNKKKIHNKKGYDSLKDNY